MRINTPKCTRSFQRQILEWYKLNKRDYPWRNTTNPFFILVAEMMLQQTDAPKAVPVYYSFIERFSSIKCLAQADINELSALLSPIGLKYRAQRLISISQIIVNDYEGQIPDSEELLLSLPGIGRYIARSICASGFGQKKGILDTNIIRILDRYFNIQSSLRRAREDAALWDLVNRMLPPSTLSIPAEWNWALLDFAASLCTHYKPKCESCVLRDSCKFIRKIGKLI